MRWCGDSLLAHLATTSVPCGHTEAVVNDTFLESKDTPTQQELVPISVGGFGGRQWRRTGGQCV